MIYLIKSSEKVYCLLGRNNQIVYKHKKMNVSPQEYWSQVGKDGRIERWSRNARRKMMVWRLAILLARALKRGLDIFGSLGAMCAFSPIFAVTALLIKLEDRG